MTDEVVAIESDPLVGIFIAVSRKPLILSRPVSDWRANAYNSRSDWRAIFVNRSLNPVSRDGMFSQFAVGAPGFYSLENFSLLLRAELLKLRDDFFH